MLCWGVVVMSLCDVVVLLTDASMGSPGGGLENDPLTAVLHIGEKNVCPYYYSTIAWEINLIFTLFF